MEQPQAPMGNVVPPPPQIRAFPTGPGLWRIDWFGLVMFPDRLMRARQPSVLVYLSLVVAPNALADPSVLLKPDATWARRQTKRWVSVGTMMLLRIGDIWSDQKLVAAPDYESTVFEKLLIARETTELVKAGVSLDKGLFLLPLGEHPWHGENTQSYCLRVNLEDGRSLIIPCMELIRFYFGSSSALLSRLFDPPMRKENLFSNLAFNSKTKWMKFDLAEGFPRASVGDIARIAGSHTAWMAALRVLTSCMKASTAGQDIYPQAIFPFEGLTDLTATGKWLSLGGRAGQLSSSTTSMSARMNSRSVRCAIDLSANPNGDTRHKGKGPRRSRVSSRRPTRRQSPGWLRRMRPARWGQLRFLFGEAATSPTLSAKGWSEAVT